MFSGPSGYAGYAADGGDRGGEPSGSGAPPGRGAAAPTPAPESAAEDAPDSQVLHNRTKKRGGKRERRPTPFKLDYSIISATTTEV